MTQATDTDIRELKDLITGLREEMKSEFSTINTRVSDLREETRLGFSDIRGEIKDVRGDVKTINARLTNLESNTRTIADLAEKVGELKNWKQIAIVIFTATVGGTIGYFARSGKF